MDKRQNNEWNKNTEQQTVTDFGMRVHFDWIFLEDEIKAKCNKKAPVKGLFRISFFLFSN